MIRPFIWSVLALAVLAGGQHCQAALLVYTANLDGPSESPPVASPGVGHAIVSIDTLAHTMRVQATFSDLIGVTTVAHIHAPTAVAFTGNVGVATYPGTFPGFPVGVTSGTYDMTFDLTQTATYTTAFLNNFGGGTAAGAEAALIDSLDQNKAYFNIHTNFAPGGEIRGFFQAVPEPSSMALLGAGAAALAGYTLRRRKAKAVN